VEEAARTNQYNELGGANAANSGYVAALSVLDGDMPQYISDNTDDEVSHAAFINAYLASKGAPMVNLDVFRRLPSSKAPGAVQIGRLTNLMRLTVDTSWWTRYRSRNNPDLGGTFPQLIPSLNNGQHPAIPRNEAELGDANNISSHVQSIANTAGFTLRSSSRAAAVSMRPWPRRSPTWRYCVSSRVSVRPRPRTFKRGTTRQATLRKSPMGRWSFRTSTLQLAARHPSPFR
jgi:hypothetical protein